MKKSDLILILVIALVSSIAYFVMQQSVEDSSLEDGVAVVIYKDEKILEISLVDGSYTILDDSLGISVDEEAFLYTIPDTNGTYDLVIEYGNHMVRVVEEESPQHICSIQGWSNSPLAPITCLPNNLVIIIETGSLPDIDDITS
jgi:hypothetical protein